MYDGGSEVLIMDGKCMMEGGSEVLTEGDLMAVSGPVPSASSPAAGG